MVMYKVHDIVQIYMKMYEDLYTTYKVGMYIYRCVHVHNYVPIHCICIGISWYACTDAYARVNINLYILFIRPCWNLHLSVLPLDHKPMPSTYISKYISCTIYR